MCVCAGSSVSSSTEDGGRKESSLGELKTTFPPSFRFQLLFQRRPVSHTRSVDAHTPSSLCRDNFLLRQMETHVFLTSCCFFYPPHCLFTSILLPASSPVHILISSCSFCFPCLNFTLDYGKRTLRMHKDVNNLFCLQ